MQTLTEKIFSNKLGRKVSSGETVECPVNYAVFPEGSFKTAMDALQELGKPVANPDMVVVIFDHYCPPNTVQSAELQAAVRRLVKKHGIKNFHDSGEGICHQILCEKGFARPGSTIVGGDSHTTTYGAFGAFATGMGATDMAIVLATGRTWFKIPDTYMVRFTGKMKKGVYAKDIALAMLKEIGADGAIYKALEFESETLLSMESRMTICNMAVECGAKNGIFAPDGRALAYLKKAGCADVGAAKLRADKDAKYEKIFEISIPESPLVACPDSPDNVKPISEVEGTELDQVFIGSCTNGRIEDLKAAAHVFNAMEKRGGRMGGGARVKVRTIICPASRTVYLEALRRGWIEMFVRAGCMMIPPGCGPCLGAHSGILAPGETGLATTNRNFKGRMGSPESKLYLSSPATAAASAIEGRIADARRYL